VHVELNVVGALGELVYAAELNRREQSAREPPKIANSASLLQKAGATDSIGRQFPFDSGRTSVTGQTALVQFRQRSRGRRGQAARRGRARYAASGPSSSGTGALPREGRSDERAGRGQRVVRVRERRWPGPDRVRGPTTGCLRRAAPSSAAVTVSVSSGTRALSRSRSPDTAHPPGTARWRDARHALQRPVGSGGVPASGVVRALSPSPGQSPAPAEGTQIRALHATGALPRLGLRDRDARQQDPESEVAATEAADRLADTHRRWRLDLDDAQLGRRAQVDREHGERAAGEATEKSESDAWSSGRRRWRGESVTGERTREQHQG